MPTPSSLHTMNGSDRPLPNSCSPAQQIRRHKTIEARNPLQDPRLSRLSTCFRPARQPELAYSSNKKPHTSVWHLRFESSHPWILVRAKTTQRAHRFFTCTASVPWDTRSMTASIGWAAEVPLRAVGTKHTHRHKTSGTLIRSVGGDVETPVEIHSQAARFSSTSDFGVSEIAVRTSRAWLAHRASKKHPPKESRNWVPVWLPAFDADSSGRCCQAEVRTRKVEFEPGTFRP